MQQLSLLVSYTVGRTLNAIKLLPPRENSFGSLSHIAQDGDVPIDSSYNMEARKVSLAGCVRNASSLTITEHAFRQKREKLGTQLGGGGGTLQSRR